jgi:hypothetical protein
MRMLEVFSSEDTYLPALQDASCVVSVIEQVLHYMIHSGKQGWASLGLSCSSDSSLQPSEQESPAVPALPGVLDTGKHAAPVLLSLWPGFGEHKHVLPEGASALQ